MTLRELRRTLGLPQREIARRLQKGQEEISRIENRADLLLSTLQSYVRSLGGTLELLCRFTDRAPVRLRTNPSAANPPYRTGKPLPRLPAAITRHATAIVALCKRSAVRRLAVFGSALRPEFDPTRSAIDFAVEFAGAAERSAAHRSAAHPSAAHRYFDFKAELEALLGQRVDLVELAALVDATLKRVIEESQIPLYAAAS